MLMGRRVSTAVNVPRSGPGVRAANTTDAAGDRTGAMGVCAKAVAGVAISTRRLRMWRLAIVYPAG